MVTVFLVVVTVFLVVVTVFCDSYCGTDYTPYTQDQKHSSGVVTVEAVVLKRKGGGMSPSPGSAPDIPIYF